MLCLHKHARIVYNVILHYKRKRKHQSVMFCREQLQIHSTRLKTKRRKSILKTEFYGSSKAHCVCILKERWLLK